MQTRPDISERRRIDPDAIYRDGELRLLLGLTESAMAKARRSGQLRYSRQGRSILYRGRWVLDWLESDAAGGQGVRDE